ncbi:MAG: hypothetical protein M5U29_02550 [Anaerolineae bacterium]|nr:hypothetical protein [Anaerolineae bacterium]
MSNKSVSEPVWFSQFFGIELPQYELPFVDFNIHSDVPLYIDPYAITKDPSNLAAQCHNSIVSYFQCLIEAIRLHETARVRQLIRGRLSEPSEIYLGVGKIARRGRGLGVEQERQVVDAITGSEAARVGAIQAIQEFELHVPGIGPDKISDLVANIILSHLATFTETVCASYGVATQPCAVSGFWNETLQEWDGEYFNLPVHGTHSYILVPKRFVRRERDLMNHREFYDKFVLEVLQRELLSANDSLVQTLKSGERRVTKKSIREDTRYPYSKEFLSQFIIENPDVIQEYRDFLHDGFKPTDPAIYSGRSTIDDPRVEDLLEYLKTVRTGRAGADAYHDTVFELLQFVFDFALVNFEKEYKMDAGRGRIDVIADNYASGGIFAELRQQYKAESIPMECKNYADDLGNTEFNQLADRLSPTTSQFGMLFCRSVANREEMMRHQALRWLRQNKLMLLIDDELLKEFVELRLSRSFEVLDRRMRMMIRGVRFWNV